MKFNDDGSGTLTFAGTAVSCRGMQPQDGNPGFDYAKDITLKSSDCYEVKRSVQYGVDMLWAVGPIQWQRGAYIHEGPLDYSVGCVHLEKGAAQKFHDWVKEQDGVRLQTEYPW